MVAKEKVQKVVYAETLIYINAEWDFVKTIFKEMLLSEKWTWTELGFEAKSSSSQLLWKCDQVLVQVH